MEDMSLISGNTKNYILYFVEFTHFFKYLDLVSFGAMRDSFY